MDTNLKKPKISVVMPVLNGERDLDEAIRSILTQDFTDFEFIIINDGSTDRTSAILQSYADSRIRIITNETNKGLAAACNIGVEAALGEYIARMDCDDVSLPGRFRAQVSFLDTYPEVAVCGTWTKTIGRHAGFINKFLTDPKEIKANLLFFTSLAHPSVMIRKDILIQNSLRYDKTYEPADDYDLWVRISRLADLANLDQVLLFYRMHEKNISKTKQAIQKGHSQSIKRGELKAFGIEVTEEEMVIHDSLHQRKEKMVAADFIGKAEKWLIKLRNQNLERRLYDESAFAKVVFLQWFSVCYTNSHVGAFAWQAFWKSSLRLGLSSKEYGRILKLFLRCFFVPFKG